MSAASALDVEQPREIRMDTPERASKRVDTFGHNDQVDMVRHQAPSPDAQSVFSGPSAKQSEVEPVMGVFIEDPVPGVAALCDVMGHAGDDDSGDSCHHSA